jgi:hypothetical protein
VLLFAGGSGVTFMLSVLNELVGRCMRVGRRDGEKTQRVVWCWCVRSFGGSVDVPLLHVALVPTRHLPRRNQLVRPAPPPNRHPRRAPGGTTRPPHLHLRHLPLQRIGGALIEHLANLPRLRFLDLRSLSGIEGPPDVRLYALWALAVAR